MRKDLKYYSEILELSYGIERSKELHLHFEQGEHKYFPNGENDNTHLSVKGANEIAKIVVEQLKYIDLPLKEKSK